MAGELQLTTGYIRRTLVLVLRFSRVLRHHYSLSMQRFASAIRLVARSV